MTDHDDVVRRARAALIGDLSQSTAISIHTGGTNLAMDRAPEHVRLPVELIIPGDSQINRLVGVGMTREQATQCVQYIRHITRRHPIAGRMAATVASDYAVVQVDRAMSWFKQWNSLKVDGRAFERLMRAL